MAHRRICCPPQKARTHLSSLRVGILHAHAVFLFATSVLDLQQYRISHNLPTMLSRHAFLCDCCNRVRVFPESRGYDFTCTVLVF